MKTLLRCIVVPWYLFGWVLHVYLALTNPEIYRSFGNTALIPGFSELWQVIIMPNITFFALLLAVFELAVGVMLVYKGKWVKIGIVLSILFNLFLVQLGLTAQADDWLGDFLINRLPNLVFVILQIPLLFGRFDRSLWEVFWLKGR